MKLNAKQLNKTLNYTIFIAAFFVQIYLDGNFVAHGQEPMAMKVLRYMLIAVGIGWGILQLSSKKRFVFLRELRNMLVAIFTFLIVSLILILFRDGDLYFCLELTLRYLMSLLYAFVLINLMEFDDIYRLMACALLLSIFGWFLENGNIIFNFSYYSRISFAGSYSPFESSYFAAPSINCCAFFLYYRKNKWLSLLSFLFVLLTFKRPQIIFAIVFFLLPFFANPNKPVKKSIHFAMCIIVIICTVFWYWLMMPEYEWLIEAVTGQGTHALTSGRSIVLRNVLDAGYISRGLGSTNLLVGRGIEMDLVAFMMEMSFPVMALFVFCFASVSGRKLYPVIVMLYRLFSAMTGSGLYNVMGVLLLYLFFGSVNYLNVDALQKTERNRKWIKIKFR